MDDPGQVIRLHASCVDLNQQGVLIVGASGTGKSALALQLLALGATLVADDQTEVCAAQGYLTARAPATIKGLVEARGVGILKAEFTKESRIALVIDLDQLETERLPQMHWLDLCGLRVPCLYKCDAPHFAPAILQLLKAGRQDPS